MLVVIEGKITCWQHIICIISKNLFLTNFSYLIYKNIYIFFFKEPSLPEVVIDDLREFQM